MKQISLFDDTPTPELTARTRSKNVNYDDFVEKFKPKKTTDDCYTPPPIYGAVADWVAEKYNLSRENFVRPFYPGGDYKKFEYKKSGVVVDNPPFSILARILDFYNEKGIKYFLFAPTLTLFSKSAIDYTSLPVGATVTYENGAKVNTSFVTNLDDKDVRVRSAPDLYKIVETASKAYVKAQKKQQPKYIYPDNVLTAAMAYQYSHYGVDYVLHDRDCVRIEALDSQKAKGKAIFGKGFLLSDRAAADRAAADRAAAEVWSLSERELTIIEQMSLNAL